MKALTTALFVLATIPAFAQSQETLVELLGTWADRSVQELQLPDAPAPYRANLALLDGATYTGRWDQGAQTRGHYQLDRPARVEVVVGSPELDSSRFAAGGFSFGPAGGGGVLQSLRLVTDTVPIAIERDLWLASDASYKAAISQLQAKEEARAKGGGDTPPQDWNPSAPVRFINQEALPIIDQAALEARGQAASDALWTLGLETARALVAETQRNYIMANSAGTRLVQSAGYAVLYVEGRLLRDDGVVVKDGRQWVARRGEGLPSVEEVRAAATNMGEAILARAQAPAMDFYEGPVVFEGEAAADLLRSLATPELEGTPSVPQAGRSYQEQARTGPRIGRRLLPPGWSITDDPQAGGPELPGRYTYDMEGVPGQAISLVEDGFVRTLAMNQVPRAEITESNGHARGGLRQDWTGRLSVWQANPKRLLSTKAFYRSALKLMRDSGVESLLVVRSLAPTSAGRISRTRDAVWLHADGSSSPVLAMEFQKADRRALRDIVAAGGGLQTYPYLAPFSSRGRKPTDRGLPSALIAPKLILVDAMEAVFPGPTEEPHILPAP